MAWFIFLVSLGSIPLAAHMAHARRRSPRAWAWIAVLVGPLAPLALLVLGKTEAEAAHLAPVN